MKGGNNLRDVVRRITRSLVTNVVATQLNWTGQGTKTGFHDLELRNIFESKHFLSKPPLVHTKDWSAHNFSSEVFNRSDVLTYTL